MWYLQKPTYECTFHSSYINQLTNIYVKYKNCLLVQIELVQIEAYHKSVTCWLIYSTVRKTIITNVYITHNDRAITKSHNCSPNINSIQVLELIECI